MGLNIEIYKNLCKRLRKIIIEITYQTTLNHLKNQYLTLKEILIYCCVDC